MLVRTPLSMVLLVLALSSTLSSTPPDQIARLSGHGHQNGEG